jgi:hypothetical protein
MRLVAPWLAPHSFLRVPREDSSAPAFIVTRGITATELVAMTDPPDAPAQLTDRALDRLGAPWLASIADRLRAEIAPPRGRRGVPFLERSALSEFFGQLDVGSPGSDSPAVLVGESLPPRIPAEILERFEREDLPRVTQYVQHEIAPLVRHVEAAADANESPDAAMLSGARRYLGLWAPPLDVIPLRRPSRPDEQLWGLTYSDLVQRVAVELFELATLRPRLQRCVFCNAVFVPQAHETNCRWNLWVSETGELLSPCNPERFREWEQSAAADAHRRTRKKLDQRIRRALLEANGNFQDAVVERWIREKQRYMDEHARRPGPRPKIESKHDDVVNEESGDRDLVRPNQAQP